MPRTKYKKRPDGRRVCAKSYTDFGDFHYTGRKYFYGATDEEIDNKIAEWEKSQQRQNNGSVRTFKEVAVEWWAEKEKELSPKSLKNQRIWGFFNVLKCSFVYLIVPQLLSKVLSKNGIKNSPRSFRSRALFLFFVFTVFCR